MLIDLAGKDESPRVRATAVWSLNKLGPQNPQVVKVLLSAIKDEAYIVRLKATAAMNRKRGDKVLQALIVALEDPCQGIRRQAVRAIHNRREKQAVPALIKLLKGKNWHVSCSVIYALGNIKDSRAVGPLIDLLSDSSATIKNAATNALRKITGRNFSSQAQWRRWFEKNREKNKKPDLSN